MTAISTNRSSYGKERIVLSRRGKDLVAVIPIEDLKLIEIIENKLDIEEAKEAVKEAKLKGTISLVNLKKKYYKAMRSEYKIEFAPNAQRQLKKLSKQLQLTIKSLGISLYAGFPPTQEGIVAWMRVV
ncbi:MAG TPA: hypothetical protein LFW14_02650 [Rickettsia endosymbiont of Degeeriella rufa]|nr:hypothetical protein [Rickettsia endosymbiont of Degeeriella rufa]